MDLRGAYVVLELEPGASEEAVRDARKTLVKVWHPDRHANDPELEKRAQIKLAEINEAFEVVRAAGFPAASKSEAKPEQTPESRASAAPTAAPSAPPPARPVQAEKSTIEIVPRRRVRWSVLVLILAAAGFGAYAAVVKLGASEPTAAARDAGAIAVTATTPIDAAIAAMPPDAAIAAAPPDAAEIVVAADAATPEDSAEAVAVTPDAASTYRPPSTDKTFSLGATHEQVLAAQGKPTSRDTVVDEQWMYGYSIVTFNRRGKVTGWWDRDDVLNVKLEPSDPAVAARAKAAGSYGMGASKDEVLGVQGTPNHIENVVDETWYFGKQGSSVTFNGSGGLRAYHNVNNELHLQ